MTALDTSIAIVGGGAMGSAIASGIVRTGTVEASRVLVADHNQDKRMALEKLGLRCFSDAAAMAAFAPDVVILAVKPQVLPATVRELGELLDGRLVLSIAAGVTLGDLEALLPASRVVRVMPNLPVRALSGASAVCAGTRSTRQDVSLAVALFGCLGSAHVMREDQLDVEGAVVSCGPAYVALFADMLTRAAVEHGLGAAMAREMVLVTMRGVAQQLLDDKDHPRSYMERVTSPGGTTAAGLRAMEPLLFEAIERGVDAALTRTADLAAGRGE